MFQIDKSALPFVRTQKALLVIDLQNEFVGPDGGVPVSHPPDFVNNILSILPDFRKSGKVIWVRSEFATSRSVNCDEEEGGEKVVTDDEVAPRLDAAEAIVNLRNRSSQSTLGNGGGDVPVQKRLSDAGKLMEADVEVETSLDETFLTVPADESPRFVLHGSVGAKLCKEAEENRVAGLDIDHIKTHYSAFRDGKLVQLLRAKFVTEIYICGALSNISVFATAMEATQFGYAITLVSDCLGYRSKDRHDEAVKRLESSTGCDFITSKQLLKYRPKAKTSQRPSATTTAPRARRQDVPKEKPASSIPKEAEIDSLMSKLDIGSKDGKTSELDVSQTTVPEAPIEPGSVDDEVEEYDLPVRPTRRAEVPHNRVPIKIRTRRRIPKEPEDKPPSSTNAASEKESSSVTGEPASMKACTGSKTTSNTTNGRRKSAEQTNASPSVPEVGNDTEQRKAEKQHTKSRQTAGSPDSANGSVTKRQAQPAICEGDTTIIHDFLQGDLAENVFQRVRDEVQWQKMSHQGGDVPRLVAVQGSIDEDGSIPIYRHPADESPPLLPFSPIVNLIREQAEKELGHPLNHVLVQLYRDGTDYISEHSDKTLDIVPNTYIVNVSLGAQRTMIFRTKKKQTEKDAVRTSPPAPRQSVRAPMPHNSMCKVGLVTNMRWLHGIRQDKRLASEKSNAELAYDGARISLTFRRIGTFLSSDQQKIWGQGAVSKTERDARFVINGNTPEAEQMIRAFGQENHSSEFDWNAHYGEGFDVLHLNSTIKLFLSTNTTANASVKLALSHFGIKWEEGALSPSFKWKDGSLKTDAPEIPTSLPIKFVDNDLSKSTITGDFAILLYLNAVYGPQLRPQMETARLFSHLQVAQELCRKLGASNYSMASARSELAQVETFSRESAYLAGNALSIVDWMILPVLDKIYDSAKCGFGEGLESLSNYYLQLREDPKVMEVLGRNDVILTPPGGAKQLISKEMQAGPVHSADDDSGDDSEDD